MKHSIVIADDDTHVIAALKLLLRSEGYDIQAVTSPQGLLDAIKQREFSLALIDMNYQQDTTSGFEGLALIKAVKAVDNSLPVVVMTGYAGVDIAVQAMLQGADDFVQKPWDNDRLLRVLLTQIRLAESEKKGGQLIEQNNLLMQEVSSANSAIIAESAEMSLVMSQLEKLAASDMNILLTGDNGTGKSMLAEHVHAYSSRNQCAFIAVNMGAISESLFETEMFGHVKGAFTDAKSTRIGRFELAQSGTLFLDEIGNIPLSQQGKLLRVLESHSFEKVGSSKTQQANVRIISATNAPLDELITEGRFRQDLLYRLNTVEIRVPALKERVADIMPLAHYFLIKFGKKYHLESLGFDEKATAALMSYHWPGNIRELSHMVERAIFLRQAELISIEDLGLADHVSSNTACQFDFESATLDEIEKHIISQRLHKHDHKPQETSTSLGLSRSSYYRRLEKYHFKVV
ncbi:Sigma-54 dependent DNA-binding response regulator, Fis family [Shewanella piezotolerans WP3]|uniref:Sigma-54 dependent DNA-binding response regulator, Fis family n=1 Tax=Shewanella piezotolerans (strain WP3 / JCM 13877) TaxID=225849 RepID=B8CRM2_SHEPW|nr:sigma-54 dependent transcriptional regulator [Shewanella piezotolerans]ACJ30030.1 Sigma-54 dependent DNA-binding response regulator, Fis family [Shewanella piezotolerans WP3]